MEIPLQVSNGQSRPPTGRVRTQAGVTALSPLLALLYHLSCCLIANGFHCIDCYSLHSVKVGLALSKTSPHRILATAYSNNHLFNLFSFLCLLVA